MTDLGNRRPLKSRDSGWARGLARGLAKMGVTPDAISFMAVVFAALGCAFLVISGHIDGVSRAGHLIAAGVCIQLRLVCNLLDGMVAVEHGKGSPHGPIWNELPDRIADALFLVGAGYYLAGTFRGFEVFGWAAAALAILTAYVRELGRGLGLPADFSGPMAKPHRMAVLTLACAISAAEMLWLWRGETMMYALILIIVGTVLTVARRTWRMARALKARSGG